MINMACSKPIQVYNLNKGEKVKFKKYSNIEVAKLDMNMNYDSNNFVFCRKCIECKLDNAKEGAIRSALECKSLKDNGFITLTYSDEFIPVNDKGIFTVRYKDLRQFLKSLREYFRRKDIKEIKYLSSLYNFGGLYSLFLFE